jgi:hypothetical protein
VNRVYNIVFFAALAPLFAHSSALAQEESPSIELYRRARASVVRIELAGCVGAGFVVGDGTLVATAFHVVESARPITIALANGTSVDAEVLAVDEDRDLALLKASRPIGAPLELRSSADVGEAVLAIGHPFGTEASSDGNTEGLLNWSVSQGIVSAMGPVELQTDAALNPGNSGGPLLGRDGRVIGVAVASSGPGVGMAVRSEHLARLIDDPTLHEGYSGDWSFHFGASFVFDFDREGVMMGPALGLSLDFADKLAFTLSAAYLFGAEDTEALLEVDRQGFSANLAVQYRLLLPIDRFPLYLVPGVGVGVSYVNTRTNRLELQGAAGCDLASMRCPVDAFVSSSSRDRWSVRPEASLGLEVGYATITYTFALDLADPALSTHRIGVGFRF